MIFVFKNVLSLIYQKQNDMTTIKNKAKYQRQIKAMKAKAIELGFKNIREAEAAGFSNDLKNAFENAN